MKCMVFILLFLSIGCTSTMAKKNSMEMGANMEMNLKRKPSSHALSDGTKDISIDEISLESGEMVCFLPHGSSPITLNHGLSSFPVDGNTTFIIQKQCKKNKDIWIHPVSSEGTDYHVRICCTKK